MTRPLVMTALAVVAGAAGSAAAAHGGDRAARRPRSRSRYDTAGYASSVVVFRTGLPDDPLFTTR